MEIIVSMKLSGREGLNLTGNIRIRYSSKSYSTNHKTSTARENNNTNPIDLTSSRTITVLPLQSKVNQL